jgi:NADH-quinone oxidoreductase subunit J
VNTSFLVDVLFWIFAAGSVVAGWLVFRADSMVRAAYWLLASFVGVGAILVLLAAEFLGLVLILMMAGEMTIMAVFMVMFMMNPAGLNPMQMVHQHGVSIAAGIVAFLALAAAGIFAAFPDRPASAMGDTTAELGIELLGDSMLVFQTAGVALLTTMIGAIVLSSRTGRYGDAQKGSKPPEMHLRGDEPTERHAPEVEEEVHHH